MIQSWHVSEQELKFQFSYLTLGRCKLKVLACDVGPDTPAADVEIPPDKGLESGMIGFVMRGLPLAASRPLFEAREGYLVYTPNQYQRYYINLQQSFDDYAEGFRAKTRSTIRRKVKKFAELSGGTADFRVYQAIDEIKEFHASARRVSAVTYQENLLESGLPDNPEYIDRLCELAEKGQVRGYILYYEGAPVSYLLFHVVDDILVYKYLGFDPAFRKWSIGTVLHWLALQRIFEEQTFRMLDFTEGEGEQKRQFASGSVNSANVYCLKGTPAVRLWLRLHAATNGASKLVGSFLDWLRLRTRVRRLLRGA